MLNIQIIAKDKIAFEGEALSALVPTKSGIIEILPEHMQLVSALSSGDLILQTEGGEKKYKINGGVLEVRPKSEVVILADVIEEIK